MTFAAGNEFYGKFDSSTSRLEPKVPIKFIYIDHFMDFFKECQFWLNFDPKNVLS